MAAHARGWRKCGNHVGMATHTRGQGRNFDGFGGVGLRQENELVLAQIFFFGRSILARKWLAKKMTKTRQNENENFQTMTNRDDS